ncbi:single-stranded DNA-binding protein [Candidatus Nitrosotalea bavarica]|uniref:single-stranded DNA-binding protein n=1 Tax=Candidatus Nitrosotalea bavarica TaxID=1903277 RepID=UPI000C709802|nr:single-stranded DNA-binding protein [Candidatus Nitrosotalea bavarica]
MSEFDSLLSKLLEQRPDLTKAQIDEMIQKKKEKIGAGYLTDQGALFLIASDLGVSLNEPLKVEMGLKDLYVGAKEITLATRVMNVYPVKQFARKDGSQFLLRTMTVYDGDSRAQVKLWDEKANLPGIENLKPGDLVKIIKAYVKSDMKGNPIINVGSGSNIEPNGTVSNIPSLDAITDDVGSVKENQQNLVVTGILDGNIRATEFTNFKGEPGKSVQLRLKGKDGTVVRVVLWNVDQKTIPKVITSGAKTRLIGVKTKVGQMGLELHGDEGTVIEIEGATEIQPIIMRILSITKSDSGNTLILGTRQDKNLISITDTVSLTKDLVLGDVIECMPSKVYGNSITLEGDSFVRKIDDQKIPTLSEIRTKIKEIKPADTLYCVEAIILKSPEKKEIQTKTGETILLSETFIEDDTGQIWLKGWRSQARLLEQFTQGEIITVTAVNAKSGLEGRIELFLSPYSVITRKN